VNQKCIFGCKSWIKPFKPWNFVLRMKYFNTFVEIYTESKPIDGFVQRRGGTTKCNENCQRYVYQFHYKGYVLVERSVNAVALSRKRMYRLWCGSSIDRWLMASTVARDMRHVGSIVNRTGAGRQRNMWFEHW
jgi:hypothetical protein